MSANESKTESEDGELDEGGSNVEVDQDKTKELVTSQGPTKEIYWNKKGENKLRGVIWKRVNFVTKETEISNPKVRERSI